jgi:phospholipid/cholesterol/gamma-HCH transport system substrate-binding protein
METRARFVLIGLFTILGFLGALGFVLWLAKVQLDRTYAQYDILFNTVAGLSRTGSVRYNGIEVGKVLALAQDRDDPALVRVRIEIYASTPVRADTIATLASQGVTGVSYIALEGGSAGAERVLPVPPADVPVIRSEMSVVQDLMISGPDLLADVAALIADVRAFTTPQNRDAVASILANLELASGRIDAIANRIETAIAAAEKGIASADGLIAGDIPALVADARAALTATSGAMEAVRGAAQGDLSKIAGEASAAIREASAAIATFDALGRQISSDPGRFLLGNETPNYRRSE